MYQNYMKLSTNQIRENRLKMRQKLKRDLCDNTKLISKGPVTLKLPINEITKVEPDPEPIIRTRRKTSLDIRQFDGCFDMFQCTEILVSTGFESLYQIVNKIDEGTQSVVHLCKEKFTGNLFAVKVMRTRDIDLQKGIKQQFRILKNLSHDYIIKAYNLFVNVKTGVHHLVTQFCQYENLRIFLNKHRLSTENETAQVINSILKAVQYLHALGICHRDIKPENILYDPHTGGIKLIDFEISKMIKYEHQKLQMWTDTGTLHYRAPDSFKGGYTNLIDVWAVGVICYEMLTGQLPFYNLYKNQTIRQIIQDEPNYEFPDLTECCIAFMKKCLHKDPLQRFTAAEALKSPYMLKYSSMSSHSSPKHRRNGSQGTRKGSFQFEMNKCLNEDSQLSNRNSLGPDGGIRLIVDFDPENEKSFL